MTILRCPQARRSHQRGRSRAELAQRLYEFDLQRSARVCRRLQQVREVDQKQNERGNAADVFFGALATTTEVPTLGVRPAG